SSCARRGAKRTSSRRDPHADVETGLPTMSTSMAPAPPIDEPNPENTPQGATAANLDVAGASRSERVMGLLAQIPLLIWAIMVIFPFLWMIMTSLKTNQEILFSPWSFPDVLQWENFSNAWNEARIGRYVLNSVIVISMSLTGTLLVSAMAAYVISRFQFPGNRFIFYLFMAGLMFPVFLGLVPLYFLMDDLGIKDTYHGLALVYIAYSLPFTIFFLVGFFKTLPGEVAEASTVDGAGPYRTFFQIMLP